MKVKCMGYSHLDFTSKEGQQVKGTNLFAAYSEERIIGLKTDKFFINSAIVFPTGLKPGDEIEISFNRRGKVESVTALK